MLISSIAIVNALHATCHYREAIDKSIDACTHNHAASIHTINSKDIASKAYLFNTRYVLCLMVR